MTFLEVMYADQAAARAGAAVLVDKLKATGEWHLQPSTAEKWKLELAIEQDLTAHQRELLGGEMSGTESAETAKPENDKQPAEDTDDAGEERGATDAALAQD